MTRGTQHEQLGLLASLSAFATTLLAIAHTRLDLLSNDLDEEREQVFAQMILTLVALFCLGVGVVLALILLVVTFWETHQLLVLGGLSGCFVTLGMLVWTYAQHRMKTRPRVFAASLSELTKDRQQFTSRR
jgi:uncharacterized membrane protein YqjE